MMLRSLARLAPFVLLSYACRESNPLPPGNWQGRCAKSASGSSANYGPPPTSYVVDKSKILTESFAAELQRSLAEYQRKSCHPLMVVVTASLEGSTLEEYTLQYANRIGLGYRGLNNGLMLLLAPTTRQARIQIGCGLEDVVSDAQASQIMQRDLLPPLRDGDPEQGVRAALASLEALASKKTIAKSFRPEGCR